MPDEVDTRGRTQYDIPDKAVATAIERIDASGVVAQLEEWRHEDGFRPHLGGRPTTISAKAVLVAFLLLACANEPLHIRSAAKLLNYRISSAMRAALDLPEPIDSFISRHRSALRWEENIRSTLRRHILDPMDPFPARRYESMTMVETQEVLLQHDTENAAIKKERLDTFTRLMINMTFGLQRRDIRRASRGMDLSIDQTYIEPPTKKGFSRKRLKKDVATERRAIRENRALTAGPVDPFAGWYPKSGERPDFKPNPSMFDTDPDSRTSSGLAWGWVMNLASRVDSSMSATPAFPRIIAAATISMPNVGVSEEAVSLMRAALANPGTTPGVVDADKAYFANALPERLHEPTFELGYRPSTDYRKDRLGNPRGSVGGVLLLEGGRYCPSLPKHLMKAAKEFHDGSIDKATFDIRIEERQAFEVHVKERPNEDGKMRVACPARGAAPSVVCPIIEMSAKATAKRDRPFVDAAPDVLPDICRQHAITMNERDDLRDQQAFKYGTPQHEEFHRHARQSIESTNAQMKSGSLASLEQADRRPARGFAAAGFFATMSIVAFNIAKIAAFLHDLRQRQIEGIPDRDSPVARRRDTDWYNPYIKTLPAGKRTPSYIEEREARQLAQKKARAERKAMKAPPPLRT